MTLKDFFKSFDLFADAPNAVTKTRELVLEFAVQGKLVNQASSDGCASDIFIGEKWREGETRHEVPDSWIWIRFGGVGEQRLGKMLDQKGNKGAFKPYLRNTNVQWMRFDLDDIKELRLEQDELEEYRLRPGDLLICEGGEPGRCAIWRDQNCEMYFQKAIHRVRPRKGILSEYLAVCLQIDAQNGILARHFTGATIKHFTGRSLNDYSIPLPPLAEQRRIVAKVDELMSLCDRLEAQQQERETRHTALARASLTRFAEAPTPANLNLLFHKSYNIYPADLRKSILNLAVQGLLVAQDDNDEPAFNKLLHILREREKTAKTLRLPKPDVIQTDVTRFDPIPSNWTFASPDQLTAFVRNALTIGPFGSSLLKSDYTLSGVPLVFVRDIRSELFGGPNTRFVSKAKAEELSSHTVRPGDVLITKMGDPPGDTSVYPQGRPPGIITADCIKLTPHRDLVMPEYLRYAIRAPLIAQQFAEITLGVAQQKVSLGRFRCIALPLPPLREQRRIVAKVDELMALVDALEIQLTASRTKAAQLMEAVVAELTSQKSAFP